MKVIGAVAEYNPFHTGHARHLSESRRRLGEPEAAVVCVMSGNWVQSARPAIADKWLRASLALMGGADLVLELPTLWAVSSAETFARGAVSLLEASGVVDVLSFGSECGDADRLRKISSCLDSPLYHAGMRRFTGEGMAFAACRQAVVRGLLGEEEAALLSSPNNNLGVEYLRALNHLGSAIAPMTVRREGAGYHQLSSGGEAPPFLSATGLRERILSGDWQGTEGYLLPGADELLRAAPLPTADLGLALLSRLRAMTAEDWAALPDSGAAEGLPQRLARAGTRANSVDEFFALAKTRRFTHARLRRLLLWAYLGLTKAMRPARPPCLRVLGFSDRGRALLREMDRKATLPVLTKPAHVHKLDEDCRRVFALEARCTDLYALCFPHPPRAGLEWERGPVTAP